MVTRDAHSEDGFKGVGFFETTGHWPNTISRKVSWSIMPDSVGTRVELMLCAFQTLSLSLETCYPPVFTPQTWGALHSVALRGWGLFPPSKTVRSQTAEVLQDQSLN